MRALRSALLMAACLTSAGAAAQSSPALIDSYARVTALLSYMTSHVAELLLACAAKDVLTAERADASYAAYRKRNAALLERVEAWSQDAEARLGAQGEERAAQRQANDSGLTAMAAGLARAQEEIDKAADVRKACAVRLAAIESGRYDLSGNAELIELLKGKP